MINELDALANIDLKNRKEKEQKTTLDFIRIGTCGIIQEDIPVGSPIVSDYALGLDNLMSFYHYESSAKEKAISAALQSHLDQKALELDHYLVAAPGRLLDKFGDDFYHGITITAPGFYAPQGRQLRYQLSKPQLIDVLSTFQYEDYRILNFEMETSAIYGLAKILGHEAITIDLGLANRKKNKARVDYHTEMKKLVKRVLDTVVS